MLRRYLFVQDRVGDGGVKKQNVMLCPVATGLTGELFPYARTSEILFSPIARAGRKEIDRSSRYLNDAAHRHSPLLADSGQRVNLSDRDLS